DLRLASPAPRRKRADTRDITLAAIEKIAVERDHHIGPLEARDEAHVIAETKLGRETLRFGQERIVNAPPHLRVGFEKLGPQTLPRRRVDFFDEEREARAAVRRDLRPELGQIFFKRRSIPRLEVFNFFPFLIALALL